MTAQNSINGIILAGGKSSRMGTDKGLLPLKGSPLIQHCINALQPFVDTILIITSNQSYRQFGHSCYPDIYPDCGPLGGIYTGLFNSSTETNLILSCDTPFVTENLIKLLLEQHKRSHSITTIKNSGKLMPTIGVYEKELLPVFEKKIKEGKLKLKDVVMEESDTIITIPTGMTNILININTKEEYKQVL